LRRFFPERSWSVSPAIRSLAKRPSHLLRGFLQERAALKQRGVAVGESMLFFGCRDPLQDFLYEDEMRAFEAAGVTRLFSSFSREPGKPKTYVQQAIKNHSEDVWRLLQQDAVVFVCGEASRMAPEVRRAFVGVFQERTATTAADGGLLLRAKSSFLGDTGEHRVRTNCRGCNTSGAACHFHPGSELSNIAI
jgi:hypothetical protein